MNPTLPENQTAEATKGAQKTEAPITDTADQIRRMLSDLGTQETEGRLRDTIERIQNQRKKHPLEAALLCRQNGLVALGLEIFNDSPLFREYLQEIDSPIHRSRRQSNEEDVDEMKIQEKYSHIINWLVQDETGARLIRETLEQSKKFGENAARLYRLTATDEQCLAFVNTSNDAGKNARLYGAMNRPDDAGASWLQHAKSLEPSFEQVRAFVKGNDRTQAVSTINTLIATMAVSRTPGTDERLKEILSLIDECSIEREKLTAGVYCLAGSYLTENFFDVYSCLKLLEDFRLPPPPQLLSAWAGKYIHDAVYCEEPLSQNWLFESAILLCKKAGDIKQLHFLVRRYLKILDTPYRKLLIEKALDASGDPDLIREIVEFQCNNGGQEEAGDLISKYGVKNLPKALITKFATGKSIVRPETIQRIWGDLTQDEWQELFPQVLSRPYVVSSWSIQVLFQYAGLAGTDVPVPAMKNMIENFKDDQWPECLVNAVLTSNDPELLSVLMERCVANPYLQRYPKTTLRVLMHTKSVQRIVDCAGIFSQAGEIQTARMYLSEAAKMTTEI